MNGYPLVLKHHASFSTPLEIAGSAWARKTSIRSQFKFMLCLCYTGQLLPAEDRKDGQVVRDDSAYTFSQK